MAKHTCMVCGSQWTGRKRRFCYSCLPVYSDATKSEYMRIYVHLLYVMEHGPSTYRPCDWCGVPCRHISGYCPKHRPSPVRYRECPDCGALSVCRPAQRSVARCDDCNVLEMRRHSKCRKLIKRGVYLTPYRRADIFERDGWVCQLCGKRIDKRRSWPDQQSGAIDHIVPLSLGGHDVPENVQAVHARCNSSKGTRPMGEQLRLVG
jgi:5-methylcytosine-specific restriction endonuclease McrA